MKKGNGRFQFHQHCSLQWGIVVIALLVCTAAPGQESAFDISAPRVNVDRQIEYLIDADESLSPDQVRSPALANRWRLLDSDINLGYELAPVWYRFAVANPGAEAAERYFEIGYPLLDHVEMYRYEDNRLIAHLISGDQLPFHQRLVDYRHVVFPQELPAGSRNEMLLRVQTSGAHRVPIRIWQPAAFERAARDDMMLLSAIYGIVLAIGVLNVLLYFGIGQRRFLYLGSMLFLLLVAMAALHGVAYQYVYPAWPLVHDRVALTSVPLMCLFLLAFSSQFLQLDNRLPVAGRVVRGLIVLTGISAVGAQFLPYAISMRASAALVVLVSVALLAFGILLAWKGNRNARVYLLAWTPMLLGAGGKVLVFSGLFSSRFMAEYAWEFGAVGASLLFSYVLGEQFHQERKFRLASQRNRIRDLRQREQTERKSARQARRHPLTGLPNRAVLESRLDQEIKEPGLLAVILLHVKSFDDFNRTLGHENADDLLRQFAQRLNRHATGIPEHIPIEPDDGNPAALAHMDGVTLGCAFRIASRDEITPIMKSLADNAGRRLSYHGMELSVDVVLGCAFSPDDSTNVATLLRHAFIAYGMADGDIDRMAIYDEQSDPYSHRRLTLMPDLKQAIGNNDLMLYFQPQLRMDTGEISGFEALLRWEHAVHGFVPPDEFVSMAERASLMRPLTEWVLDRALIFCQLLKDSGHPAQLSVNVSAVNLRDHRFSAFVLRALENHRLEPGRLVLEVTETAAMRNPEHTLTTLRRLNDFGVGISIDDFGTGHSSLSYLSQLPVHEIKIDRSFVLDMERNQNNRTIVRTTINMCHDLGYRVVAEGVESRAAMDLLRVMGCDIAQGYFLSHPLPQQDILDWLEARQKPATG